MKPVCELKIQGNNIKILIDSGAGSNVIDEKTYNQMKVAPRINKARTKIYAFNCDQEIPVVGKFKTEIELEGKTCSAEFTRLLKQFQLLILQSSVGLLTVIQFTVHMVIQILMVR